MGNFRIFCKILIFIFSWYSTTDLVFGQFKIPEKPAVQTSVYDYVGLLTASEKSSLEDKLIKYSDTTSTQIVLAVIASTEGENINYLGAQWGEKWGIGQAREDNGLLILLARDDRRIAINTGRGIEHLLTDALSKRIIENIMLPEFKKGDYYAGLNRGADVIFEVLQGEYQGTRLPEKDELPYGRLIYLFFIIMIVLFILSRFRRRGGGGNRGKGSRPFDPMDFIILSSLGRGGYRGSVGGGIGGSGGFGGGFGGGSFGGGGASGSW